MTKKKLFASTLLESIIMTTVEVVKFFKELQLLYLGHRYLNCLFEISKAKEIELKALAKWTTLSKEL